MIFTASKSPLRLSGQRGGRGAKDEQGFTPFPPDDASCATALPPGAELGRSLGRQLPLAWTDFQKFRLAFPRLGGIRSEIDRIRGKRPVSLSSPEARAFFGGGEVTYTPTEN